MAPNDLTLAITCLGGGINGPLNTAIDGVGNVWMVNSNNSLSEINGLTGAAISPAAGYTGGGLAAPFSIAINSSKNAWVVNPSGYDYVTGATTSPTSVSKFSSAGVPGTGSPYTGGGLSIANNFHTLSPHFYSDVQN